MKIIMDETFELLSSMSPKLTKVSIPVKKAKPTVLSLKKCIRRSSFFDKIPRTLENDDLIIVEGSTDSSGSSAYQQKVEIKSPIIILDSSSESSFESNEIHYKENLGNELNLSNTKRTEIKKWIDQITICSPNAENTIFSEVSTICGDTPNVRSESSMCAANSTENGFHTRRFDELFRKGTCKEEKEKGNIGNDEHHSDLLDNKNFIQIKDISDTDTDNGENLEENEVESLLDSLYGNSWRHVKNNVLLKSEPRNIHKRNLQDCHTRNVHSERKLNKVSSNNISEHNLLKSLQTANMQKLLASPGLDINSCSEKSNIDRLVKSNSNVRVKLDFSNEDSSRNFGKYTSNYHPISPDNFTEKENNFNIPAEYVGVKVGKKASKEEHTLNESDNKMGAISTKSQKKLGKKQLKVHATTNDKPKVDNITSKTEKVANVKNDLNALSSDDEWDQEVTQIYESARAKKAGIPTFSFLASLSKSVPNDKCDPAAKIFRDNFKYYRDQLVTKLFKLFTNTIFDNVLPSDSFEWSDTLRRTAGYCVCRKITKRTGGIERTVRIVLSTKVLDSADRLRDTLIHELCHAATWIINGVSDGHGAFWKSWALKAMRTFPELPPIKRCHDYVINTKYTYKCVGCGYSIGRHTKSLDIERKRCGHCYGKFEIFINKTSKKGKTKSMPVTPRKQATGFALFVKENYTVYKNSLRSHGDVMKLLGQKFAELKMKPT